MIVVNNLTKPGGIRHVDLTLDTVRVQVHDGPERLYRLSTILTVECAWCKKVIGEKEDDGQTGITHGICPECSAKFLSEETRE